MPEGDSIYKVAATLRPYLVGQSLRRVHLRDRGDLEFLQGRVVEQIETLGKHLFIGIGPDRVLRTHLGMKGRWRVFGSDRHGMRGPRASVVLETSSVVAVCFNASQVELVRRGDMRLAHRVGKLGPDLLSPEVDFAEVMARAREPRHADRPIGEVLLDQRVVAGIGNVYKSEVPFVCKIHPAMPVASLSDEQLEGLFKEARRQLKANLGPGLRTTTSQATGVRRPSNVSRFWVYRRHGLRCLRCAAVIERFLQGDHARSTYVCPRCQPGPS